MKINLTNNQIKQLKPILDGRDKTVPSMLMGAILIETNNIGKTVQAYVDVRLVRCPEAIEIQRTASKGTISS